MDLLKLSYALIDVLQIAVTLPVVHIAFTVASFFHKVSADPTSVTNWKNPILLVHGSDANQHQWWYFRKWLSSKEGESDDAETKGHVFSVNLNEKARRNDNDRDIFDYASRIRSRVREIKALYRSSGIPEDTFNNLKINLIGLSMGGLVSAAYCLDGADEPDCLPVVTLITICTPWHGSYLADTFCNPERSPEKYFCRDSADRKHLVNLFLSYVIEKRKLSRFEVYNYGSRFDWHVPAESAQLSLATQVVVNSCNDHSTVMMDATLARFIRDRWIV